MRVIFGFLLLVTSIFSQEKLEVQIKKSLDNKKIEIVLSKNMDIKENKIQIYKIQSGDTLSELSVKLNNSIKNFKKLNNIKDENLIFEGKELKYYLNGELNEIKY